MKIKINLLDQYILQQIIILFIGSVGLLASVAVALGTISDLTYKISEYNLPLLVAVQIFCLKIPEYAAYALPIALLLTTLLVYGRLNNNLELIAFYSSGISIYSIVAPAIFFSLSITVTTFLLNEFIVPPANYQVAQLESNFVPETNLYRHKKDIFYPEYQVIANGNSKLVRLYYAQQFDGNRLKKIIILNWGMSHLQKIIVAQQATWNQNQKAWQLRNGRIENIEPPVEDTPQCNQGKGFVREQGNLAPRPLACFDFVKVDFFSQKTLFLPPIFFEIASQATDPQKMSLRQALKYLKLIIKSNDEPKIRLFKVSIQQKLAFPFICFVFAMIGSGVGVKFNQINRGRGFSICVGIVFTYYLLGFIVGSLGIVGLVSPLVAGWLPNFLGWVIGGWLLYCSNH